MTTWNQFVAQIERRAPRHQLPANRRISNRQVYGKAFPRWNERVSKLAKIDGESDHYKAMLLAQREYLLDLRELHPDKRRTIEPFLRAMPRYATKTLGGLD